MSDQPAEIRHRIGRDGSFTLRTVGGSVRVRGADIDEAVVVARTSRGSTPRLNVERGTDRLVIDLPPIRASFFGRGLGGDADIDFEVELPRHARLNLAAVSADMAVEDIHAAQAYKTVSGDVALKTVDGQITVRSVSGDLLVRGGSISLEAVTTSGDVEVEADRIEQLSARSVSGNVDVSGTLVAGPRHAVETVSGDLSLHSAGGVTVQPARALDIGRSARRPIVVGDGAAHLSFRSMSGAVRVIGGHTDAEAPAPERALWPPPRPEPPAVADRPSAAPARRLEILRALERGDIDIDEAYRQLEEVTSDA